MVGAVAQVMQIFEVLVDSGEGVSVSDLSGRLGINKGSASRLLATLEAEGYLVQNPITNRYELTLKLLSLSNRFTDRLGFPGGAQPILDRLAAEAGELVQLSAADGEQLYVIAKAEGDARIAVKSLIGRPMALHATAAGRAWLSALPLDEATAVVARRGLSAYTPCTITDLSSLREELQRVSTLGYAMQDEELIPHVSAVAVPVCHRVTGAPVGALDIVAPTFRFSQERRLGLRSALKAAAGEIESIWPDGFARGLRADRSGHRLLSTRN